MKFLKFSVLQYVAIFASIVANFFLAKYITKENYGLYSLGIVFYNIINGICDYGLERNGLVRLNKHFDKDKLDDEYLIQFLVRAIITLLFSIVLIGYIGVEGFSWYLVIYVLATFIVSIIPKYYFDFHNQFIKESLFLIADRFGFLIILSVFYVTHNLNVFTLAVSYFLSRLIYVALTANAAYVNKRHLTFSNYDVIKAGLNRLFKENFLFWMVTVFNIILLYANQLVLTSKAGVDTLATFSFAMQFISLLRILQTQYLRWNTPYISNEISKNTFTLAKVHKMLLRSFLFSLVVSLGLYFSAAFIILKFYPNFHDSIKILLILCIWSVIYGPGLVNSFILSNKISSHSFFFVSVTFTVISLVANILLGSGALITTFSIVVPHTVSMLIQYYLTYKNYNAEYQR